LTQDSHEPSLNSPEPQLSSSEPPTHSGDTFDSLFERHGEKYRWLAVATCGLGAVATAISSTSVNVAIPPIIGTFGISQGTAQWISSGYLAAATVTMLITAWLIQSFGIRKTVIIALLIFAASSVVGAMSPNIEILIASRIVQGAASGLFMPMATYIMSRVFPPEKQGMAMGLFGVIVVMAPAVGPYLGGILVDAFDWRYAFFLPIPMALVGIILTANFLPEREEQGPRKGLDWLSVLFLSSTIFVLLLGLSKGQSKGWSSDFSLACFFVFGISAIAFIWQQKRSAAPLLDLSLFSHKGFTPAAIVATVFGAGLYSSFYLAPLFLQNIQSLNATTAGLVLLPGGIMLGISLPIAGRLADRVSPRFLIALGVFLVAYSSWLTASADRLTAFSIFIWWVIIGRIGMACIMPSLSVAAFKNMPMEKLSQGSGATNFVRQFGGALGVNLSAIYLERRTSFHMSNISASQNEGNPASVNAVRDLAPYLQEAGVDQVQQIPVAVWFMGREFYRQATTLAFQDTFAITALLFTLLIVPTLYLARGVK